MSHYLYASRDDAISALQAYYPPELVAKYLVGNEEEGYSLDQQILFEYSQTFLQRISQEELSFE